MKHRIALIGCGGMAKAHVSRLEKLFDRIEVTAVVDINLEQAEKVAALLPSRTLVTADCGKALDVCDAVLLALPHHLHCEYTIRCLEAGKHVLAEKPFGNSVEECLRMMDAEKKSGKVLMVAYCMRFHPLLVKMKELIEKEEYGKVFQLSIWTEQHTEREASNWMCRKDTLGGGQLFSHGCHYIDLMLWMMGKPVYGSHIGSNLCTPWMEREGTSNVSIKFESGAMGYHFGTWGARGSRLGYAFHAHCEKGMLEADINTGKLYFHGGLAKHEPGVTELPATSKLLLEAENCKPTVAEMAHFIDCIETGRAPFTDTVSSLEGLQVIWKLYEAEDAEKLADLRGLGLGTFNRKN